MGGVFHFRPRAPRGVTNPMVRVSICGLGEDRKTVVTRQIVDNGFNPRWEEYFTFDLAHPEFAMLVLEVVHTAHPSESALGGRVSRSRTLPGFFGNRRLRR